MTRPISTRRRAAIVCLIGAASAASLAAFAQQEGRPPLREHSVTQSDGTLALQPATEPPVTTPVATFTVSDGLRILEANDIPAHLTGAFPNSGNPNTISAQTVRAQIDAAPDPDTIGAPRRVKEPGWALNGVKFDPGAAEFYQGDPSLGWQYEALSGAIPLGLDENHAHVQPTGAYHYHGLPTLLLDDLGLDAGTHSPLVGWARDGFPIYALFGYSDPDEPSDVIEMTPSWRVKAGARPEGPGQPGGTYDGTFARDYEYVADLGTLDECNGRLTVTPEFPDGTYAYFLTEDWPVVPRCLRGAFEEDRRGPGVADPQRPGPDRP